MFDYRAPTAVRPATARGSQGPRYAVGVAIEMPVGQGRRRRRSRAAAAALAVLAIGAGGLSGCAAGRDAQTAYQKPTLDGTEAQVGYISMNAMTIQAPTAKFYPKGSSAAMRVVLVNSGNTADTLTSISSPGFAGWGVFGSAAQAQAAQAAATAGAASVTPAASSSTPSAGGAPSSSGGASPAPAGAQRLSLPPNARVPFGTPEAKGALLLTNLRTPAHPGSAVPITFTFARAGAVTVQVPVGLTASPQFSTIPSASGGGE